MWDTIRLVARNFMRLDSDDKAVLVLPLLLFFTLIIVAVTT